VNFAKAAREILLTVSDLVIIGIEELTVDSFRFIQEALLHFFANKPQAVRKRLNILWQVKSRKRQ
jgi:hypothetical protein